MFIESLPLFLRHLNKIKKGRPVFARADLIFFHYCSGSQQGMGTSFNDLCRKLAERLELPLPGKDAHELFRATPVGDVKPLFDHAHPPRPGGVLILLYEDNSLIKFPLIKRAEYLGAHSGQISLPGGKAEEGEEAIQTAMRECEEEIG